jgi:transcriptional regulator with XRE-family HTH domain
MGQEREALKKRLKNRKHREAFVSTYTDQTIPFQIRALRLSKQRNWTQEQLALEAGMKQERISALENPNYGQFSLKTLKQLASAFDVALIVRFAPFGELAEWTINLSSESLEVPSFKQDRYFQKIKEEKTISADREEYVIPSIREASSRVVLSMKDHLATKDGLPSPQNVPAIRTDDESFFINNNRRKLL